MQKSDSGVEDEEENRGGAEGQGEEAEKENGYEVFRKRLTQALCGCEELLDDWITTEVVIRETGREAVDVSSGQRTRKKLDGEKRVDKNARRFNVR